MTKRKKSKVREDCPPLPILSGPTVSIPKCKIKTQRQDDCYRRPNRFNGPRERGETLHRQRFHADRGVADEEKGTPEGRPQHKASDHPVSSHLHHESISLSLSLSPSLSFPLSLSLSLFPSLSRLSRYDQINLTCSSSLILLNCDCRSNCGLNGNYVSSVYEN